MCQCLLILPTMLIIFCISPIILSVIRLPGTLLAGYMVDPIIGRLGTLAISKT